MDVHYIWIGPPKNTGQDIDGPLKMKKALDSTYKVYFWCLEDHASTFEKRLSSHGITVRSIEGFLNNASGTLYQWWYWYGKQEDWAVSQVALILKESLETPNDSPIRIREIVNAKNAVAYLLAYTWGGFVMDSNVLPTGQRALTVTPDCFKAPVIGKFAETERERFEQPDTVEHYKVKAKKEEFRGWSCRAAYGVSALIGPLCNDGLLESKPHKYESLPNPEVWMFYSPRYSGESWRALEAYICSWHRLKALRKEFNLQDKGDQKLYHDCCAGAVIDALLHAVTHDDAKKCKSLDRKNFWCARKEQNEPHIDELGIRKIYNNTHKVQ